MKATLAETFRWLQYRRFRGVTLEDDTGARLVGMIVVDLDNLTVTLDKQLLEYTTDQAIRAEIKSAVLLVAQNA